MRHDETSCEGRCASQSCYPPVRFAQVQTTISTSRTVVTLGSQVPVRYLPGLPDQAEIDRPFAMWGFPILACIVGTAFLALWVEADYRSNCERALTVSRVPLVRLFQQANLGAQTGDVRKLFLRHGLSLTATGIVLGERYSQVRPAAGTSRRRPTSEVVDHLRLRARPPIRGIVQVPAREAI